MRLATSALVLVLVMLAAGCGDGDEAELQRLRRELSAMHEAEAKRVADDEHARHEINTLRDGFYNTNDRLQDALARLRTAEEALKRTLVTLPDDDERFAGLRSQVEQVLNTERRPEKPSSDETARLQRELAKVVAERDTLRKQVDELKLELERMHRRLEAAGIDTGNR